MSPSGEEYQPDEAIVENLKGRLNKPEVVAKTERQLRTIDLVVQLAEELGIEESVYLLGGFTHEATKDRPHDDVDLIIKGREAFQKLTDHLVERYDYKPITHPYLENTSRTDFQPNSQRSSEYDYLDVRWVQPIEKNGVLVWKYVGEEVEKLIGKPLAIPDSAFSKPGEQTHPGARGINFIYPEYGYLTKEESIGDKHRFDRFVLKDKVDAHKMEKIRDDATKADVALSVTPQQVAQLKQT